MVARKFYHLPYFRAKMSIEERKMGRLLHQRTGERGSCNYFVVSSDGGFLSAGAVPSIDFEPSAIAFTTDSKMRLHRGVFITTVAATTG